MHASKKSERRDFGARRATGVLFLLSVAPSYRSLSSLVATFDCNHVSDKRRYTQTYTIDYRLGPSRDSALASCISLLVCGHEKRALLCNTSAAGKKVALMHRSCIEPDRRLRLIHTHFGFSFANHQNSQLALSAHGLSFFFQRQVHSVITGKNKDRAKRGKQTKREHQSKHDDRTLT